MAFSEDECRDRADRVAANFITSKHTAHNLIRRGQGELSLNIIPQSRRMDDFMLPLRNIPPLSYQGRMCSGSGTADRSDNASGHDLMEF